MNGCDCCYCGKMFMVDETLGEDSEYEMECPHCENSVVISANIIVTYYSRCRENQHDMRPSERHSGWEGCARCDRFRKIGKE